MGEEAASIARHLIMQVLLIVNADKRQISLLPLLLKLRILSLQKCYMKMILSNSIRDILRYSLTSTSQHSCVLFLGTKKDRAKHSRHVQPAGKPYNTFTLLLLKSLLSGLVCVLVRLKCTAQGISTISRLFSRFNEAW